MWLFSCNVKLRGGVFHILELMTHRLFQGRHTRECGPLDIPPLFHPEPPASRTASTPPFQLGFPWACHNRSPCHSCSSSSSSYSLPRILEDYRLTFLILEGRRSTLGGKAKEKESPHLETGVGQQHEELSDKVNGSIRRSCYILYSTSYTHIKG